MQQALSHIQSHARWYVLAALVILSIVLWSVEFHENRNGVLTIAFLNIGQGDSIFIESPTGTQIIVDGGPDRALMNELPEVMPWYDHHIDMLVVTNPDRDHYEGFIPLLRDYSVDAFFESGTHSSTTLFTILKKEVTDKHIPDIVAARGQRIDIGGGAYLDVLFPDRDVTDLSSNDGSLVMRLVYGDTSVALQGDSTARIEEYLTTLDHRHLKSTILKTGHHGSRTSTTPLYVAEVDPEWAVISSGADSTYGHPHQETLDTLNAAHIPILDTCVMGRIVFHSDGKVMRLENRKIIPVAAGCKIK